MAFSNVASGDQAQVLICSANTLPPEQSPQPHDDLECQLNWIEKCQGGKSGAYPVLLQAFSVTSDLQRSDLIGPHPAHPLCHRELKLRDCEPKQILLSLGCFLRCFVRQESLAIHTTLTGAHPNQSPKGKKGPPLPRSTDTFLFAFLSSTPLFAFCCQDSVSAGKFWVMFDLREY